jgi:hypothetical protein
MKQLSALPVTYSFPSSKYFSYWYSLCHISVRKNADCSAAFVGTSQGIRFMTAAFINFLVAFEGIFIMYQPVALLLPTPALFIFK